MAPNDEEARGDLIMANHVLTELKRRETDFDVQMRRLHLTPEEEEVARCKRNLLERGKLFSSDCTLARAPRLGELMASTGPNEVARANEEKLDEYMEEKLDDYMEVS